MKRLLAGLIFLVTDTVWAAEYTKLTPAEILAEVKAGKAVLVDVREEAEWDEGHLKLTKSLPLSSLEGVDAKGRAAATKDLPKDKTVFLHCKSGVRCLKAANLLEKDGLKVQAIKTPYPTLEKTFGRAAVPAKQP
jgi:rhodanese-related sulfurtransferase